MIILFAHIYTLTIAGLSVGPNGLNFLLDRFLGNIGFIKNPTFLGFFWMELQFTFHYNETTVSTIMNLLLSKIYDFTNWNSSDFIISIRQR